MASVETGNLNIHTKSEEITEEPVRLLIVEDCKAEQARLEAMLCHLGYEVLTAETGRQGLEILGKENVSLVLSDWRMPEMSGIELCRAVQDDPELGNPYFILVTGCHNKCDLVAGMDAGADDFVTKPFNAEELRVRVQAGKRIIQLRREAEQKNQALESSLAREAKAALKIQRDLHTASRMQRELLPDSSCPMLGLSIAQLYQPLETVAGDSFNYFPLDTRNVAFFQCDVVGHGIAAAMISFALTRHLSPDSGMLLQKKRSDMGAMPSDSNSRYITAPEDVVAALNNRFLEKGEEAQYFTMVYGVLDTVTGRGRLCQAGHPYPIIIGTQGRARKLGEGGFPVGMFPKACYQGVDFHLASGERMALYSDGISECHNRDGVPFESERLANLLVSDKERTLDEQVSGLTDQLQDWRKGAAQEDDISLLVIERSTGSEESPTVVCED